MEPYPKIIDETTQGTADFARQITRMRDDDIGDFTNLPNIFISGRKVGKVPTSSIDVAATDKLGDVNYTNAYLYILIDNAGAAEWRRVALGVW